jgi:hypothetical protein
MSEPNSRTAPLDPEIEALVILLGLLGAGVLLLLGRYPALGVILCALVLGFSVWRRVAAWQDFKRSTLGWKAASLLGWLALAGLCGGLPSVVDSFGDVFQSFGSTIPRLTELLLAWAWVVVVAPIYALGLWLLWPGSQPTRGVAKLFWALITGIGVSSGLALYLPIIEMSRVV